MGIGGARLWAEALHLRLRAQVELSRWVGAEVVRATVFKSLRDAIKDEVDKGMQARVPVLGCGGRGGEQRAGQRLKEDRPAAFPCVRASPGAGGRRSVACAVRAHKQPNHRRGPQPALNTGECVCGVW